MPILFYGTRDKPHGCFSNFSRHPFDLDGCRWPTSEHYFQAHKFLDPADREAVRQAPTAREAAQRGREWSRPLRPDWEQVKDDVMRRAVLAKFEAHTDIRAILLATGDETIVENAPTDYYWGCGVDGSGRNRLGQLLMEVRSLLRQRAMAPGEG